jgi:hypothetical protein
VSTLNTSTSLTDVFARVARLGYELPECDPGLLVDVWNKDGEIHSQIGCVAGSTLKQITLEEAITVTFAPCQHCGGREDLGELKALASLIPLLELLETDSPKFSELVKWDAFMWRGRKSSGSGDLLRDAFAVQADLLPKAREEGSPLEMYGRFCAPVASYLVRGRQIRELVQWIERIGHEADLTATWTDSRYGYLAEQLEQAITQSPKTWAVWSSPASIEERGALLRCLADETRVLPGGAETVSCGYVPLLFVEGVQHSRRDVCAVSSHEIALTCMALYRMGPALKTLSDVALAASCLSSRR